MSGHPRFSGAAHAVAFLGLCQDDGRPAPGRFGRLERGEQLPEIVSAALQAVDLLGRHVRDERAYFRVLIEEMRQIVGAVPRAERLVLAVDGGGETAQKRVVDVAGEEGVPIRTPQHLDDVPARPAKGQLQVLNDLAVAPHRPIEPLQVAVDDEGQVVELLARGERESGGRFRLVHFAVAEHAPNTAAVGVQEAAIAQIAHEAGLIDGADRADAHRACGGLPEVRHQPGMRIG